MKESSSYIQPARLSSAGSSGPVRAYGSRMSSSCFCVSSSSFRTNRLKRVQLHLASLSRHRDCGVVSDDMEGNLCHNLRDNRVDLARHNRGSVLHRRQVDLAESGPRSAGQQAQIVAHLGEVDGAGL